MKHDLDTYKDGYRHVLYCKVCKNEDQAVLYGKECSGEDNNTVDKKIDNKPELD